MKKTIIRLTENDLQQIIYNTAKRIIAEKHVLEIPKSNQDLEMGAMPPMNDPMSADPNMGMGADPNAMGGNDPNMDVDPNAMGENENSIDISDLTPEDQKAAQKYVDSMREKNGQTDNQEDSMQDPNMGADPNMMPQAPMQEAFMKEINNNETSEFRQNKRELKKLPTNIKINSPFVYIG